MNDLQVKTVKLEPAKVEFNFDELSEVLDKQLVKYEGLEFTEEDAASCKKTITELNKGKKALNDYRKKTKKELSKEIEDFEAQCKNLSNKFDDVINPLKEQHDEFEEKRKDIKRKKIQEIIDYRIEIEGLSDKFADQLIIEDSYLTKSKTMKSIEQELITKAQHLGIQQDKDEADQEIIKMTVQKVNVEFNVNLPESVYFNLLDVKTLDEIKHQIEKDGEEEADKTKLAQVPVNSVTKSVSKDDEKYVETYEVVGTEGQLEALEEYMSSNSLTWHVIGK